MKQLLHYECRRLTRSLSFYILLAVGLLFCAITVVTTYIPFASKGGTAPEASAFALNGIVSGLFSIIAGLFVSIFVCEDFASGSIKNTLSRGFTRVQVYAAKYIVSLVACLLFAAADFFGTYLLAFTLFKNAGSFGDLGWVKILSVFLYAATFHAIFFSLSMIIRKTAGAVCFAIVGPTFVELVFAALDTFWKDKGFNISDFWLSGLLNNCIADTAGSGKLTLGIVLFVVYSIAFFVIGLVLNRKRDLK